MGLFRMWREARGNVMRKEFDDIRARIQTANEPARRAFFNNLLATIEDVQAAYDIGSDAERKKLLRECKKAAHEMWNRGDWPSSLGLATSCLLAESKYVPGEDAAYVNSETAKVIHEATDYFNKTGT